MFYYIYPFLATTVFTLILGPIVIPILRTMKFGQVVRDDGPQSHLKKRYPYYGGVIFIISIIMGTLIFTQKTTEILIVLTVFLGFAILGFADDFIKVVLKRSLGLKARSKLIGQVLLGLYLGFYQCVVSGYWKRA